MNAAHSGGARRTAITCAAAALALTAASFTAAGAGAAARGSARPPIARTHDGAVRGKTAGTVDEFLGIPYAAPPTGRLRWRPPRPPAHRRPGPRDDRRPISRTSLRAG